jgi:hypothetical protein
LLGLFLRGSDTCASIYLGAFGVAVAVIHYNDLGISFLSNTGNRTMRFGVGKRVLDLVVSVDVSPLKEQQTRRRRRRRRRRRGACAPPPLAAPPPRRNNGHPRSLVHDSPLLCHISQAPCTASQKGVYSMELAVGRAASHHLSQHDRSFGQ